MSKQDRQGVRTPADLERKYPLGKLNDKTGDTSELGRQINQLSQSMSTFMASTNGAIAELTNEDTELNQAITNLEEAVAELEQGGGGSGGDSGGQSSFVVTVEADSLETESITADKTFAEIDAAIQAGMDVKVKLLSNGSYIYLQMTAYLPGSEVDFCGYYGYPLVLQIFADE